MTKLGTSMPEHLIGTDPGAFAEFLKARRAARGFAHHHEHQLQERQDASQRAPGSSPSLAQVDEKP